MIFLTVHVEVGSEAFLAEFMYFVRNLGATVSANSPEAVGSTYAPTDFWIINQEQMRWLISRMEKRPFSVVKSSRQKMQTDIKIRAKEVFLKSL